MHQEESVLLHIVILDYLKVKMMMLKSMLLHVNHHHLKRNLIIHHHLINLHHEDHLVELLHNLHHHYLNKINNHHHQRHLTQLILATIAICLLFHKMLLLHLRTLMLRRNHWMDLILKRMKILMKVLIIMVMIKLKKWI